MNKPRLVLFGTGAASVALALWHFSTRGELADQVTIRATQDLNGLSMLFVGLVTAAVAWMAVSRQLLAGYALLAGLYYIGHAWILFFARISWTQAIIELLLAIASLFAASAAWSLQRTAEGKPLRR